MATAPTSMSEAGREDSAEQQLAQPSPAAGDPSARHAERWVVAYVRGHADLLTHTGLALVLIGVAERYLVPTWITDFQTGSPYRALHAALVLAVLVGIWRQLSRPDELPIHDRHVDALTALGALAVAVAMTRLLAPRFTDLASAARFDLLAGPIFLFALGCATFGTRPTWRHRYSLAMVWLTWPVPYDMLAGGISTSNFGWWMLAVILAVAGAALLDTPWRRRNICLVTALVVGWAVASQPTSLAGPISVLASLGTLVLTACLTRSPLLRPREPLGVALRRRERRPVVTGSRWTVVLLVVTGVVLVVLPRAATPLAIQSAPAGAHLVSGPLSCPTLASWSSVDVQLPTPSHRVSDFGTLRCSFVRTGLTRPVRMRVDLTSTVPASTLQQFPWESQNAAPGAEQPTVRSVPLGHGISAWVLVYQDSVHPLTTVVVTWEWLVPGSHGRDARRVSVIVNDDPLVSSPFPHEAPILGRTFLRRLQRLLRTNLTQAEHFEAQVKNRSVAVAVATDLVMGRT